jgi:serine/threonine protein kinase
MIETLLERGTGVEDLPTGRQQIKLGVDGCFDGMGDGMSAVGEQLRIPLDQITFVRRIGGGSAGTTYAARWEGSQVAVKVAAGSSIDCWWTEVRALKRLSHPHIVDCLGILIEPPTYGLVLELCQSDLSTALRSATPPRFLLNVAEGVCSGMVYLHAQAIMHRDLKGANVLLDSNGQVKLTDFGMAVDAPDSTVAGGCLTAETGTLRWMAPEVIRHERYSKKADVYSYAMVLFELLTHQVPFADRPALQAAVAVALHEQRPRLPDGTPSMLRELLTACWARDPAALPTLRSLPEQLSTVDMQWLDEPSGHPGVDLPAPISSHSDGLKPLGATVQASASADARGGDSVPQDAAAYPVMSSVSRSQACLVNIEPHIGPFHDEELDHPDAQVAAWQSFLRYTVQTASSIVAAEVWVVSRSSASIELERAHGGAYVEPWLTSGEQQLLAAVTPVASGIGLAGTHWAEHGPASRSISDADDGSTNIGRDSTDWWGVSKHGGRLYAERRNRSKHGGSEYADETNGSKHGGGENAITRGESKHGGGEYAVTRGTGLSKHGGGEYAVGSGGSKHGAGEYAITRGGSKHGGSVHADETGGSKHGGRIYADQRSREGSRHGSRHGGGEYYLGTFTDQRVGEGSRHGSRQGGGEYRSRGLEWRNLQQLAGNPELIPDEHTSRVVSPVGSESKPQLLCSPLGSELIAPPLGSLPVCATIAQIYAERPS